MDCAQVVLVDSSTWAPRARRRLVRAHAEGTLLSVASCTRARLPSALELERLQAPELAELVLDLSSKSYGSVARELLAQLRETGAHPGILGFPQRASGRASSQATPGAR